MPLDFSRCRLEPFAHQKEDIQTVINHPFYFIANEMRTGKSATIIIAAQFLFEAGLIDNVIVVAPAPVRSVWYDEQFGEFAKHLWLDLPAKIIEFHAQVRTWQHGPTDRSRELQAIITNFEFIRNKARLLQLLPFCGPKTMLVLDESSFIKDFSAQRTKACLQLRRKCGRVYLLNGTPIFFSPLDLFSQGNLLHPDILECPYITLFKARYAVQSPVLSLGGRPIKKTIVRGRWQKDIILQEITGWTNLDDLERRFKPHTVRRLQSELDLPPKLDPVTFSVPLEPLAWQAYRDMRNQLVVWLTHDQVATSATAAIRALRLSQITSGFLGGIEGSGLDDHEAGGLGGRSDGANHDPGQDVFDPLPITGEARPLRDDTSGDRIHPRGRIQEIGREKLDCLLWFIEQRLEADPNLHLVAWSRWRAEIFRAVAAVQAKFPQFVCAVLAGSQTKAERQLALSLLKPETTPSGPVFVGGIEGTGSFGINMTAAHTCVTLSSGYSPGRTAQTLDRVYGPGQKYPIAYYNIVATGPKGQKTIDADILMARTLGEDIARRTTAAWVKALTQE